MIRSCSGFGVIVIAARIPALRSLLDDLTTPGAQKQRMPDLNSEAIDFRAASEFFKPKLHNRVTRSGSSGSGVLLDRELFMPVPTVSIKTSTRVFERPAAAAGVDYSRRSGGQRSVVREKGARVPIDMSVEVE